MEYEPTEVGAINKARRVKEDEMMAAEREAFDYLLRQAEGKVYRLDEVAALAARQVCYEEGHLFDGKYNAHNPAFMAPPPRIVVRPSESHDCRRCDATITITYPELGVER